MTCSQDIEEMYTWLDQIPLSRQRKHTCRDFSDGVMMAELLKFYYPKIVELHNYPQASRLNHKITNWTTLHRKVLTKIGIRLSKDQIEQVASAVPEAINQILLAVKNKIIEAQEKRENKKRQQNVQGQHGLICFVQDKILADSILGVPLACETGGEQRLVVAMESMVPQRLLDEKVAELSEKEEAINVLMQKVSHLDTLIKLKDQRIKDLTQQLHFLNDKSKTIS